MTVEKERACREEMACDIGVPGVGLVHSRCGERMRCRRRTKVMLEAIAKSRQCARPSNEPVVASKILCS